MKNLKSINEVYITSIKEKNAVAKALFSTFKGAIETELKNGSKKSEQEIIETLAKKFTENALVINNEDSLKEVELLKVYLPAEVSIETYNTIIADVLTNNEDKVKAYKSGNTNIIGALLGATIKKSKELNLVLDAKKVQQLLIEKLK